MSWKRKLYRVSWRRLRVFRNVDDSCSLDFATRLRSKHFAPRLLHRMWRNCSNSARASCEKSENSQSVPRSAKNLPAKRERHAFGGLRPTKRVRGSMERGGGEGKKVCGFLTRDDWSLVGRRQRVPSALAACRNFVTPQFGHLALRPRSVRARRSQNVKKPTGDSPRASQPQSHASRSRRTYVRGSRPTASSFPPAICRRFPAP